MSTPKLTPAVELLHRNKLKTDIETIPNCGAVFTKPTFFTSQQDLIDQIGKQAVAGEDLEAKFCQITWLGFEDDPNDGCEDNPTVKIIYRLHFFHEFKQERSDGSNSHDDFVAMILNLRNKFLVTIQVDDNTEREPLKTDGYMITDENSEFFRGAFGHWINLITKIEVS